MLWGQLQIGLFWGSFLYILGLFKTKVQNGNVLEDHTISSVFYLGGGGVCLIFIFFFFLGGGGKQ